MAIAARIPMIATTTNNSISVKPFSFFMSLQPLFYYTGSKTRLFQRAYLSPFEASFAYLGNNCPALGHPDETDEMHVQCHRVAILRVGLKLLRFRELCVERGAHTEKIGDAVGRYQAEVTFFAGLEGSSR
jgi:hypothetical protein